MAAIFAVAALLAGSSGQPNGARSSRALGHVPDPALPPPPGLPPAPNAPPPPPNAPPLPPAPPPPPLPPLFPAPVGYNATIATADALYEALNGTAAAAIFLQPGAVLHLTTPLDFFDGQDIVITSDPDNPATIDGRYATQLVRLSGGASLRLAHVHLVNGAANGPSSTSGRRRLSHDALSNLEKTAGAMYMRGGSRLFMSHCTISHMYAVTFGAVGATYGGSVAEVHNCTFHNATSGNYGGLWMVTEGSLTMGGCNVTRVRAYKAGLFYASADSTLTLTDSTFDDATARADADALSMFACYSSSTVTATRCTFSRLDTKTYHGDYTQGKGALVMGVTAARITLNECVVRGLVGLTASVASLESEAALIVHASVFEDCRSTTGLVFRLAGGSVELWDSSFRGLRAADGAAPTTALVESLTATSCAPCHSLVLATNVSFAELETCAGLWAHNMVYRCEPFAAVGGNATVDVVLRETHFPPVTCASSQPATVTATSSPRRAAPTRRCADRIYKAPSGLFDNGLCATDASCEEQPPGGSASLLVSSLVCTCAAPNFENPVVVALPSVGPGHASYHSTILPEPGCLVPRRMDSLSIVLETITTALTKPATASVNLTLRMRGTDPINACEWRVVGTLPPWLQMPIQSGVIVRAQSILQMEVVMSTAGLRESIQPYLGDVALEVRSVLLAENGTIPVILSVVAPTNGSMWVGGVKQDVPVAGAFVSATFAALDIEGLIVQHQLPTPSDPRSFGAVLTDPKGGTDYDTTIIYLGEGLYSVQVTPVAIGLHHVQLTIGNVPSGTTLGFNTTCPSGLGPLPDASACVCEPGREPLEGSAGDCKPCDLGYVKEDLGNFACTACAPGSYQADAGQSQCTHCPEGTLSELIAAKSDADCMPCQPGDTSAPGSTQCNACGAATSIALMTATTEATHGPFAPRGIDCNGGKLIGTLAGHWASTRGPHTHQDVHTSRVWTCNSRLVAPESCMGGLNSSCRHGHDESWVACSRCLPGFYLDASTKLCVAFSDGFAFDEDTALGLVVMGAALALVGTFLCCVLCARVIWCGTAAKYHDQEKPWVLAASAAAARPKPLPCTMDAPADEGVEAGTRPCRQHVWLHDPAFADFDMQTSPAVRDVVSRRLLEIGLAVSMDDREAADEEGTRASLSASCASIFLLSSCFFSDARSVRLLQHAQSIAQPVILILLPGATFLPAGVEMMSTRRKSRKTNISRASSRLSSENLEKMAGIVGGRSGALAPVLRLIASGDEGFKERFFMIPENAWDKRWSPYVPEVIGAFYDEPIAWSEDYQAKSMCQLFTRLAMQLKGALRGKAMPLSLREQAQVEVKIEEEHLSELASTAAARHAVVEMEAGAFDVYLSCQVAGVGALLTPMMDALVKHGYSICTERFDLSSGDQIRPLLSQCTSVLVLLTADCLSSWWLMNELTTACELGIDILLVPIEGERWIDPKTSHRTLSCPTPAMVAAALVELKVDTSVEVQTKMATLFNDGLDAPHNLSHVASGDVFMRVLTRRLGASKQMRGVLEKLGSLNDPAAVELLHLVMELNNKPGAEMRFELTRRTTPPDLPKNVKPMPAPDFILDDDDPPQEGELALFSKSSIPSPAWELVVRELTRASDAVAAYTPDELTARVRVQRATTMLLSTRGSEADGNATTASARGPSVAGSAARALTMPELEVLRALDESEIAGLSEAGDGSALFGGGAAQMMEQQVEVIASGMEEAIGDALAESLEGLSDELGEVGDDLSDLIAAAKDEFFAVLKPLLAFLQINSSFLSSFPMAPFPPDTLNFFREMNFIGDLSELINFDAVAQASAGVVNYPRSTMFVMSAFACAIAGLFAGMGGTFLCAAKQKERRDNFVDRTVFIAVLFTFTLYPTLCQKLLRMYKAKSFDDIVVFDEEWALDFHAYRTYHLVGMLFILLYVIGIPVAFFVALYYTARPVEKPSLPPVESAEWDRQLARRINRYSMLFENYEPRCWWWEITELFRKLIMTSVIGFIEPQGSVTQIFFSAIIGLAFWLLSSAFAPFESIRTDCLNFVSQMSTVLTLLLTVALQAGMAEEGIIAQEFFDVTLIILQMAPLVCGVGLVSYAFGSTAAVKRARKRKVAAVPNILRDDRPADKSVGASHTKKPAHYSEIEVANTSVV